LPRDAAGKAMLKLRMSPDMSLETSLQYSAIMRTIPAILLSFIRDETMINRYYIVKALELILKLLQSSENETLFIYSPSSLPEALLLLLFVNTNRIESIIPENYLVSGDPYGRTRPPFAPVLLTTTASNPCVSFLHDQYDQELRELSLDVLKALCKHSAINIASILKFSKSVEMLYHIAQMKLQPSASGNKHPSRNIEVISIKALGILQLLVPYTEAAPQFRALSTEFIAAACSDAGFVELVFNAGYETFIGSVIHPPAQPTANDSDAMMIN
jgi:hypothetical protein